MCGIIGVIGSRNPSKLVCSALNVLKERGKDGFGIANSKTTSYSKGVSNLKKLSGNIVGHCLHSVVNNIPQPIKKKGIITSNCEIYNWKELKEKYKLKSKNDSELIIDLIEYKGIKKLKEILTELDGVYAFAYWLDNNIYLARDIIGVKPLWYAEKDFCFASEKKALEKIGCTNIQELNPRTVLVYNLTTKKTTKIKRDFFKLGITKNNNIQDKTEELLIAAIKKRLPKEKFGILFSGGIDSTFLAYVCMKLKRDFILYTAALDEKGMETAKDLIYAKKIAKEFGLKLKIQKLSLKQTEEYLDIVPKLIEDSNVVKVGVALTFYAACKLAKKDNIKVIFSGLGSEEIFAGYERHKNSIDINKECLSGLLKMYERDLYRDDAVTMNNNLELRLPFLDKKLIEFALKIPVKEKINNKENKLILRKIAKKIGIPEEYASRKKKAAQYGSKFDRAILKLAKKSGFKKKSDYLQGFYHPPNVKLGVLWSGGKDSAFAAYTMQKQNYSIACLISIKSKNQDSYMFHTPNIDMVDLQAKAMGTPIIIQETVGKKEIELKDLKKAIKKAKDEYGVEGIVTGALFSNYQRERVEKICDALELKIFSPLWHIDQEKEMRDLVKKDFKIIFSSIAGYGFNKNMLGKIITDKEIDELVKLNKKYQINVAGEGGEFESLVLNCPLFNKEIKILDKEIIAEDENTAKLKIKKAKLI